MVTYKELTPALILQTDFVQKKVSFQDWGSKLYRIMLKKNKKSLRYWFHCSTPPSYL